MVFSNPFNTPSRIRSIALCNQTVTLNWQSGSNRQYQVEASSDLTNWIPFASNLTASGTNFILSTNVNASVKFFRVKRTP